MSQSPKPPVTTRPYAEWEAQIAALTAERDEMRARLERISALPHEWERNQTLPRDIERAGCSPQTCWGLSRQRCAADLHAAIAEPAQPLDLDALVRRVTTLRDEGATDGEIAALVRGDLAEGRRRIEKRS